MAVVIVRSIGNLLDAAAAAIRFDEKVVAKRKKENEKRGRMNSQIKSDVVTIFHSKQLH